MTLTTVPTDTRGFYPDGERRRRSRLTFFEVMNRSDSEIESWPHLISYLTAEIVEHLRTPDFVARHLKCRNEGFDAYESIAERLRQGGTLTLADWISVDDTVTTLDMSNIECQDLGALVGAALVATWPSGPAGLTTWLDDAVRYAGIEPTPTTSTAAAPAEEVVTS